MIVPGPAFTTGVFHRSKRLLGTGACALVSRPGAGQRSVQRSESLILRPTENIPEKWIPIPNNSRDFGIFWDENHKNREKFHPYLSDKIP